MAENCIQQIQSTIQFIMFQVTQKRFALARNIRRVACSSASTAPKITQHTQGFLFSFFVFWDWRFIQPLWEDAQPFLTKQCSLMQ